ncbi:MAG: hypothetical protein E6767_06145 [Dysgonomonas sp.]|nr:hypothetical protein [Dysgonomonas sp.]
MKLRIFSLVALMCFSMYTYSQVTIGSGKSPESFSILELDSDAGGLRLNQLDQIQKDALTTLLRTLKKDAAKGLTIYDLAAKNIQYWDGEKWIQVVGTINAGTEGQFLKSNGSNGLPEWVTLKIPEIKQGDYYLFSSEVVKDDQGVEIGYKTPDVSAYNLNDRLNSDWVVLDNLTTTINIPTVENVPAGKDATRVAIQFQAGGQIATGVRTKSLKNLGRDIGGGVIRYDINIQDVITPAVSFAIGVFLGNDIDGYKLKIARPTFIEANGGGFSFSLYTVMGMISDLAPGNHKIKIAVRRRDSINMHDGFPWSSSVFPDAQKRFSFGSGIPGSANVNPFMTQSSLKVEVFVLNTDS